MRADTRGLLSSWLQALQRPAVRWAAGMALLVALLGGLATQIGPWYFGLRKPAWQPPDALFGPAWTLIYTLCAASAVQAWEAWEGDRQPAGRRLLLGLWGLNAALNLLWSVLFFSLRRPDWALWEVGPLWLSIAALMACSRPRSARAAWLLLPYLLWVAFAAALNAAVVRLNAPF